MESEVMNDPIDSKSEEKQEQSRTEFAMVIFHNIPETYPADAHIQCTYTISSDLVPTSYDWVGLYKVGWMSTKDYHYYEWAVVPKAYEIGKEADSAVLFPAHKMPNDDGEFYQFCYVTSSGQIRGASTPFQFKKPSADDYIEVEDNDMLIIRSKSVVLEERLKLMEEEKARLEQLQEEMGKETDGLIQKLSSMDKQLLDAQNECHHLEDRVQTGETYISQLNQEAHDMNIVREELQTRLDTQNHESEEKERRISRLNDEISELKAEIRKLQNEKDKFEGEMRVLTGQIELYKNHFAKSEISHKEHNEKLEMLTKDVAEKESVIIMLRSRVDGLNQEIQDKAMHVEKHVTSSREDQDHIEDLTERLKNTENKLEAAENTKKLMAEEMRSYEETKEKMSSDLEKSESTCYVLKQEQERLMRESNRLASDVEAINSELESVKKEKAKVEMENAALNDQLGKTSDMTDSSLSSLHCLQMAQKTLKERYSRIEQSHGQLNTEIAKKAKEYKQNIKELVRENEDLKERLNMSSAEYKALYIENKKLQKKLGKMTEKKRTKKLERSISESSVSSETFVRETPVKSASNDSKMDVETSSQLEMDLETMGEELRKRQEKKLKYKNLYIEEKAKTESLRKHFHEEMHKKDEETNRLRIRIEEASSANEIRVRSLEKYVSEKERKIAELEGKLRDANIHCDGPICPPEPDVLKAYHMPSQGSVARLPPNMVYPPGTVPMCFPLVYPHTTRQPYVAGVPPPQLPCKEHRPLERLRYPQSTLSPLQSQTAGNLSNPIKPLPAPLVPERLHTAKMAAVMPTNGEFMADLETDTVIPSAPPASGPPEEK
ncbi:tax1-binding protein 1 homolog B-like isoform X2 [Pecten maximus]|nr:tax1-binding protein 1 homolog B-like isoform X2 [Pecten maximus]